MSDSEEDAGYQGEDFREDVQEMYKLLSIVYHFFTNTSNRYSHAAMYEAMMDGLGYIYFCRKQWHKSSLLKSIEPDMRSSVRSHHAAIAVEQFFDVADDYLHDVVNYFVNHKLSQV